MNINLDLLRAELGPAVSPVLRHLEVIRGQIHGLARRGIRLQREEAGPLPRLRADPDQLGQVFLNLFRNGIEAMPEGGTLTVRTAVRDGRVEVEVADTGPGGPPQDLERIFNPFYTTKGTGNGLGLTLARQIVQEHGGSLTYLSQGDGGATFIVSLPVRGSPA